MRSLLITLIALTFTFSCGSKKGANEETVSSLRKEVMLIHDDVMPKMGELRQTQKQLLAMADSGAVDSVMAEKYRSLANTIELANESMMDWMRTFEPNFEGSEEDIKEYLEGQKKSIEKVSNLMNTALSDGKKALE